MPRTNVKKKEKTRLEVTTLCLCNNLPDTHVFTYQFSQSQCSYDMQLS